MPYSIASKETPLYCAARGLHVYMLDGQWFYMSTESKWMPNTWLRGSLVFNQDMWIAYKNYELIPAKVGA